MDKGGFLIYCGETNKVVEYLEQSPSITLNRQKYDNPADYIIDSLGLDPAKEEDKNRNSTLEKVITTEGNFLMSTTRYGLVVLITFLTYG